MSDIEDCEDEIKTKNFHQMDLDDRILKVIIEIFGLHLQP